MFIMKPFEACGDTLPDELREELENLKATRGLRTKFKYSPSVYSFWVDMQDQLSVFILCIDKN